jgi:tetratricopeptide (TPR) repeat protein
MRLLSVLLVAVALRAAAAPVPDAAREHYERGLAKYNLAEFDAAIVEFKQSYELSKAPRLLFDIAQAYRLKKDYESALYFYHSYLRADAHPPNLADVETRIDEMQRALDTQRAPTTTTTTPTPSTAPPTAFASPTVERRPNRRALTITGATLAGVGVVLGAVGGGLLGLAAADSSKLHDVAVSGQPWTPADDAIFREGDRSETAGITLVSVGGAMVVAGVITLVVARRH